MDEQNNSSIGNTAPQSPIYQESQDKNAKWLWLLIVLIIIGALVFAFFRGIGPFGQLRGGESEIASPTPEVSSSLISEPSPSPQAEVDRSKPSIRVLNGSGVAGVASSVKDVLEELGWVVSSIGNADEYEFDQTQITFKEGFSEYEDALVADLSDNYSVIVSSDELDATDSADIEVVVGSK
jgi:hypothetical protein